MAQFIDLHHVSGGLRVCEILSLLCMQYAITYNKPWKINRFFCCLMPAYRTSTFSCVVGKKQKKVLVFDFTHQNRIIRRKPYCLSIVCVMFGKSSNHFFSLRFIFLFFSFLRFCKNSICNRNYI